MSKRHCPDCGSPMGSTLGACYDCGGDTYRAGDEMTGTETDGWQATYNGFRWKALGGVDPKYLREHYDL